MANANAYVATTSKASWATAQTVLQIASPSAKALEILRVNVSQETSTTSAAFGILLYRGGAAMTWTSPTSITPSKLNPSDGAASSTVTAWGTSASDGASPVNLIEDGWNVLSSPWIYLPVPEERIMISPSSWFCVKFLGTVPSATYDVNVIFRELG
jgi:hypothetical protein